MDSKLLLASGGGAPEGFMPVIRLKWEGADALASLNISTGIWANGSWVSLPAVAVSDSELNDKLSYISKATHEQYLEDNIASTYFCAGSYQYRPLPAVVETIYIGSIAYAGVLDALMTSSLEASINFYDNIGGSIRPTNSSISRTELSPLVNATTHLERATVKVNLEVPDNLETLPYQDYFQLDVSFLY